MDKSKQILETLQMQPLSEEEKASRHILGRLYGPIATSLESTRNGRKYNADLWNKALADDIFKEKIANKSLFLELGHPADREETDMTKVCACIPEMPKVVDGDLYAYVDILDTQNGKLLKTLCDYGFIPGISSRGSGDIMANDEVDPETFFLETWDIVQLPAVKKARLTMCESFNGKTLKTALTESYEAASEEERKGMKEALDNLEFNLDFPAPVEEVDKIEYEDPNAQDNILVEESDEDEEVVEEEKVDYEDPHQDEEVEEVIEPEITVEDNIEAKVEMPVEEVVETVEDVAEEIKEVVEADEEQAEAIDEVVEEKKKELLPEEESKDEESEDKENEQSDEESDEDKEAEEAESEEESKDEEKEDSEEAIDDGIEEALNNLKEMIRQKGLLENEIKSLKAEKTVSDAEVASLKEELNKYKTGFIRVSELAAKSTEFEKEVQSLTEQLTLKDKEIKDLQNKSTNNTALTESVNAHETKVKSLTEKLDAMQKDLTDKDNKLNEQRLQYKGKLTEAIAVAKDYKAKYDSVISKYIESRASMLGVKPAMIINSLNENYTIEDVDKACDELLDSTIGFSNLPFSYGATPRIKITESKQRTQEDDDLEDLYILAGLK